MVKWLDFDFWFPYKWFVLVFMFNFLLTAQFKVALAELANHFLQERLSMLWDKFSGRLKFFYTIMYLFTLLSEILNFHWAWVPFYNTRDVFWLLGILNCYRKNAVHNYVMKDVLRHKFLASHLFTFHILFLNSIFLLPLQHRKSRPKSNDM